MEHFIDIKLSRRALFREPVGAKYSFMGIPFQQTADF